MRTTILQIVACVITIIPLLEKPNTLSLIFLIMNVFMLGIRSGIYLIERVETK